MAYSIVLIDADNTLLDFTRSEHDALCDCLIARDLPYDETIVARYAQINDNHWKRLERGEITREALRVDRFRQFFEEFGFVADPFKMADDYMVTLSTKSYLIEGAYDFISHLYGKCRLYLITNGTVTVQRGRLATCPITPMFDGVFISEEMGCAKPEHAYFEAVAASIPDFAPNQTIVVGDSLSSDIKGGINAGLDACWYNPAHKSAPTHWNITYICHTFDEIEHIILG